MSATDAKRRPGVWDSRWTTPYESAYSLLMKFSWANMLSASDLCNAFFGRKTSVPAAADRLNARTLLGNHWMEDGDERYAGLGLHLPCRTLTYYAGEWAYALARDEHLRFCPQCLKSAYHCAFFQIDGIVLCPIHHVELIETCTRCGTGTPAYAVCSASFERPFFCTGCGAPLAGSFSPEAFIASRDFQVQAASTLRPLRRWLRRLSHIDPPHLDGLLRIQELLPPSKRSRPQQIAFQLAAAAGPCPMHKTICHALPITLQSRTLRVRALRTVPADELTPREWGNNGRKAIYKSIRRHLYRRYMSGHHKCLRIASEDVAVEYGSAGPRALIDFDACPIAQALVLWRRRCRWSVPLCQNFRGGVATIVERQLCSDAASPDPDFKIWAWELMSSFYACCVICQYIAQRGVKIRRIQDSKEQQFALHETVGVLLEFLVLDCRPCQEDSAYRYEDGHGESPPLVVFVGLSEACVAPTVPDKNWCLRYRSLESLTDWRVRNGAMAQYLRARKRAKERERTAADLGKRNPCSRALASLSCTPCLACRRDSRPAAERHERELP